VAQVVPIYHVLLVSALLFGIGLYGAMSRRNAIGILMSLELMLTAGNINLVAFNAMQGAQYTLQAFNTAQDVESPVGQIFVVFILTIAACEAAIGLALIIAMYRHYRSIDVDNINLLKW
jgi:NADH:ubiquinone oxidoreductase subunit K